MVYPDYAYVATNSRGVYVSADFDAVGQPTWTNISSITGGGALTKCAVFYLAQSGAQFVIDDRAVNTGKLYRRTSGDWTQVLDAPGVKTTYALNNCFLSWITGYGSTLYLLINGGTSGVKLLSSTDDGVTWGTLVNVGSWPYDVGNIIATGAGGYIGANITGGGGNGYVFESDSSMASWVRSSTSGLTSSYKVLVYQQQGRVYLVTNVAGGNTALKEYVTNYPLAGGFSILPASDNQLFLGNPSRGYPRLATDGVTEYAVPAQTYGSPNRLVTSADGWQTKSVPGATVGQIIDAIYASPITAGDFVLARATSGTGAAPHVVFTATGTGAATGRAGSDPDNLATTTSIPYDCGGVCANGIAMIVAITGATVTPATSNTNNICEDQTFTAVLTPSNATTPITYVWSTDGLQSGQGTPTAVYQWQDTCTKTVSVTVSNAGGSATDTYILSVGFTLMQIAEAIKDTLTASMTPALLTRAYGYNELPEGVNDAPSLMVYWQSVVNDRYTDTDRTSFTAVRVKEFVFHVDYYQNPRNHLDENNDMLTQAASEIIDILEQEALGCSAAGGHCPPFGLCGLKTFRWTGERVTFDYGGVLYYGARFIITVRVF